MDKVDENKPPPKKISLMSPQKVFKIKDMVFAKVRGYRPWPAIISDIKADTPSRPAYKVTFYGTGDFATCKPEDLFPYEQNKSKLGNPNKDKRFVEALKLIERESESLVGKKLRSEDLNHMQPNVVLEKLPSGSLKKYTSSQVSIKSLKEEHFIGFNVHDELLPFMKNKITSLISDFMDQNGESKELCTQSSSNPVIVKNHVDKENQSKSDNAEAMDKSSSISEYVVTNSNEKRRYLEVNNSFGEHPTPAVCLQSSSVLELEKCLIAIQKNASLTTLDTRQMFSSSNIEDFESCWSMFTLAIAALKQLKCIKLYKCPTGVVEFTVNSFTQLTVLNATLVKNPNITEDQTNNSAFMTLNIQNLGQLVHLTELKLKGLSGIKLTNFPSLQNLINLKSLVITSIKEFPQDICDSLKTVTTNLTFFEIGDCDCITQDFAGVLKRFTNLISLRLENCFGRWDNCTQEVFCSIKDLEKLKILELINIQFTNCVKNELEKCDGIRALLIIPNYAKKAFTTNCNIIDCLKKLSSTLSHLIWVVTHEHLNITDIYFSQYQNQPVIEPLNQIPVCKTREQRPELAIPGDTYIGSLSIPDLETMLKTIMIHAKTKIIKVALSVTPEVYLTEHFNDL